jgi:hypothetical protein
MTLNNRCRYVITGTIGDKGKQQPKLEFTRKLIPQKKVGTRTYFNHRFRYNMIFFMVKSKTFRTRFRYNLFLNIPLNKQPFLKMQFYINYIHNEFFINGEKNIGDG